ncbi:MAG: L-aspartate oxidase [Lentisphaeria bacterium]|nr:L-aspartate oxidase [Lentisphaeria bacterium]
MIVRKEFYFDHLVIGSGLAGLSTALMLAEKNSGSIAIVTKGDIDDCNSKMAQGGIACVTDENDTFEEHLEDTLAAGAHLCRRDAVMNIVRKGPARIKWLIDLGTHFTTRAEMGETDPEGQGEFDLGREGGHKKRRILHAGDITGAEVERSLVAACRANPRIKVFEHHAAVDLISTKRLGYEGENRILGAYVFDAVNNRVETFTSLSTTLATGGCGKVYLYTSNPDGACGAGVAMGYRAFAEIANMEFYQFHPTILFSPKVKSFLISEALRGEGGVLKIMNSNGELVEFMQNYHEMKSLAPRDVVARAIDNELKRSGNTCVYLDMRHHTAEFLRKRFPNIYAKCLEAGVDMAVDPIPVVPAAHFSCGGIKTDVSGYTGIKGLYAVGETACTGLHGANRLASNSLLEAVVVSDSAAEHIAANLDELRKGRDSYSVPLWTCGMASISDEQVVISHNWEEIRRFMWDYVGIYRTNKRLERAKTRVKMIQLEIEKYYWDFHLTKDLIELRNIATVAELIIDSAMQRKESRGLHYNADYPQRDPEMDTVDTIVRKPDLNA